MVERVTTILQGSFAGIELQLEEMSNGRVTGSAVWDGFDNLDQVDRQQKVRDALRKELGPGASQVGVILTYTPDELHAMQAA